MAPSDPQKPIPPGAGSPATPISDEDEIAAARAANRFDIRRLVGFLFALYGIVLTITGIVGSSHVRHKADGINIDLWTGLAMIVFAALMLIWAFTRPTLPDPPEDGGRGSGRPRRAPA
jgi:hypothetical protein